MSPSDARARLAFAEVCGRRLQRHGRADPLPGDGPAVAAAAMCGAHAQVMSAAELSVGLRLADVTVCSVRAALWEHGTLVKTVGPRGTVHLLAARDLPHWLSALSALPRSRGVPEPSARLTADQTEGVVSAIADALAEAELTLEELGSQVIDRAGPWAGDLVMPAFQEMWPRWRQAIGTAPLLRRVCRRVPPARAALPRGRRRAGAGTRSGRQPSGPAGRRCRGGGCGTTAAPDGGSTSGSSRSPRSRPRADGCSMPRWNGSAPSSRAQWRHASGPSRWDRTRSQPGSRRGGGHSPWEDCRGAAPGQVVSSGQPP
jgi:winged helix DNA-binding protein